MKYVLTFIFLWGFSIAAQSATVEECVEMSVKMDQVHSVLNKRIDASWDLVGEMTLIRANLAEVWDPTLKDQYNAKAEELLKLKSSIGTFTYVYDQRQAKFTHYCTGKQQFHPVAYKSMCATAKTTFCGNRDY